MQKLFFVLIFILLISNISAQCNSTQININSANATELDKIIHVGNATATKIIAARPFCSVDDLARVKGIGNATYLKDIKAEELACVDEENNCTETTQNNISDETSNDSSSAMENATNSETTKKPANNSARTVPEKNSGNKTTVLTAISLNAKTIKSENNNQISANDLAVYGIATICLMSGALILLKTRKRKNEFK